jgi:hypothetical protein
VALIGACVFGTGAIGDGWMTLAFYRDGDVETTSATVADESDRAAIERAKEHVTELMDAERSKMVPFAAARLVLGLAMWALAMGALGGRGGARRALVQVMVAYAATACVGTWATREVPRAVVELQLAQKLAELREAHEKELLDRTAEQAPVLRQVVPVAQAAVGVLASAFIVLALTRARARACFEPETPGSA